jgi:hypothetical protein
MTYTVRTDTFHDVTVVTPMLGPAAHVMISHVMNGARISSADGWIMNVLKNLVTVL